jgi:DNA-binding response OmpR family regulator
VPAVSKTKVLVVDDELDMRIFLENVLRSEGFLPIMADDKSNGYRKALEERPSVIILNMMMPGEGGIWMYRNLKRDEFLKNVPVIMLSTLDKITFLKCHNLYGYKHCEAYELMDEFIEKPIEAEELLDMVTNLSNQGHA